MGRTTGQRDDVTAIVLVRLITGAWQVGSPQVGTVRRERRASHSDVLVTHADIGHHDAPAQPPTRVEKVAGLARREGHGGRGLDGHSPHRTRIGVDAGRNIDGDDGPTAGVYAIDRRRGDPIDLTGQTNAEQRIDQHIKGLRVCLVERGSGPAPNMSGTAGSRAGMRLGSEPSDDDG